MNEIERKCLSNLLSILENFYEQMKEGKIPEIEISTRTKFNIEFNEDSGVWIYGNRKSTTSAKTIKGALKILKMAYVIGFLKEQLRVNKSSTLRELYYITEGWGYAKFEEQDESDRLIEDLEILSDYQREHFHIRPEEDGATIVGPIKIREETRRGMKEIHCQDDVGEGGYQIPVNVDKIQFLESNARFVIAIETGGMRDRLVENRFDEKFDAIIVHLKGQPARSTRRLLKRLNTELNLPVVVFTDGDPWSYRIYASVAYGSIKSAHLSEYLATPKAKFLGITPSDIVRYDLPADKLNDEDIKALNAILTDPRFETEFWKKEVRLQLELNKKSEQQALAKYGLDYVTDVYLPEKLSEIGIT
ncbi:MAG: DNA topoisomerase IV subunit A [Archaeoglobaceae archaeon]|nr:DNA topoisomerase IV subunit A [Archaeoglobaceae archaeon]MDW7989354.1 DNA topoisomerase IV subunit A [Archaeoglobaceae archaeon]